MEEIMRTEIWRTALSEAWCFTAAQTDQRQPSLP